MGFALHCIASHWHHASTRAAVRHPRPHSTDTLKGEKNTDEHESTKVGENFTRYAWKWICLALPHAFVRQFLDPLRGPSFSIACVRRIRNISSLFRNLRFFCSSLITLFMSIVTCLSFCVLDHHTCDLGSTLFCYITFLLFPSITRLIPFLSILCPFHVSSIQDHHNNLTLTRYLTSPSFYRSIALRLQEYEQSCITPASVHSHIFIKHITSWLQPSQPDKPLPLQTQLFRPASRSCNSSQIPFKLP